MAGVRVEVRHHAGQDLDQQGVMGTGPEHRPQPRPRPPGPEGVPEGDGILVRQPPSSCRAQPAIGCPIGVSSLPGRSLLVMRTREAPPLVASVGGRGSLITGPVTGPTDSSGGILVEGGVVQVGGVRTGVGQQ